MSSNKYREEILSYIWELKEKNIEDYHIFKEKIKEKGKDIIDELIKDGYLSKENDKISFTTLGYELAKNIIRRQRLTERLLVDILEMKGEHIDVLACEFEHIISQDLEKSICILLGHPRVCPHGSPIPEGECCIHKEELLKSVVFPLNKLRQGDQGKVVYILTSFHPELHRLLSFGFVPGVIIRVHQVFPTFIIEIDNQQIALDSKLAECIYVKKVI